MSFAKMILKGVGIILRLKRPVCGAFQGQRDDLTLKYKFIFIFIFINILRYFRIR